jgi:DtxR family Mn-dependent transcriptional regulator|tara:strand:- start:511 stop:921 length:411 start_codon:yes stop_codon:yes gene_type:complete
LKTTKEKEHYIKEIYKLLEDNKKVSVSSLSTTLGVSKSSVSNMLKKLVKMGLVNTAPYQPIILTQKGKTLSEKIVAKHRLIESFLVEIMEFKPSQVHIIAEEIEHINSPAFFRKVKDMLKDKNIDPHGSSIPDIDF